jgi:aspartate aminotransferase
MAGFILLLIEDCAEENEMVALQLARRFDSIGFSEIAKIRNRMLELGPRQKDVYQFHGGEPFFNTPQFIKDAAIKAILENKTRYAPSSGIPDLLAAVSEKVQRQNGILANENEVIVVCGGLHGLFSAFMVTLDPGDEALVLSPYWTPIRDLVAICGGTLKPVSNRQARQEGFRQTLQRQLTERSKVVYVNSPANPSGVVLTIEELSEIAAFAREHDLAVISDEAYEDLIYDTEHVSLASLPGMAERTLTVFTFSKSYAMTGWRIGYVIAREPWMTGLRKTVLNSVNGVGTPTQWAAVAALTTESSFIEDARAQYKKRRDLLVGGLRAVGFDCELPAGTFYAFPNVERVLGRDSWKAFDTLLNRAGVSTVPGVVFGPDGEGHLRFCFSTSLETIEAAVAAMRTKL